MTFISENLLRTGALLGTTLLAGCAGMELDRAKGLSPQGSEFSKNLYSGYIRHLIKPTLMPGRYVRRSGDADRHDDLISNVAV